MKLEFNVFNSRQIVTFTKHGIGIVPEQIPEPRPTDYAIGSDDGIFSLSRPVFDFHSYRKFVSFTISQPIENIYQFSFYSPNDPYTQNHPTLKIILQCSSIDLEVLKTLIMDSMS